MLLLELPAPGAVQHAVRLGGRSGLGEELEVDLRDMMEPKIDY